MGFRGIDVSEHQGKINWDIVKGQIDFAILRLGWIGNHNNHTLDKYFERNYSECKRLGIPVGVYIYNYCKSEETAESGARWTLAQIENKQLDLPVYIDMEGDITSLGKDKLTDIVIAFNNIIESVGKYWAGVYANRNWFDNYLHKNIIKEKYTTWIAHYGISPSKYEGQYDMLQYSDTGKVNGINGNCDMNEMYRNIIGEMQGIQDTQPNVPQKTNEEIAEEVRNGLWGNGEERKNRLEEAGYNYQVIQSIVNQYYKSKTIAVGTRVKTIANGNGASDGSGRKAAKGITGTITRINEGASYPYLVSNGDPIGWYKKEALQII